METNSYEDVRTIFVESFVRAAKINPMKDAWEKLNNKIDCYADGDLDHTVDTMTLLWKHSMARGPPPSGGPDEDMVSHISPLTSFFTVTDPETHLQPSPVTAKLNWDVEIALIKSIRKGVFFDKKYWTRQSKTGSALRPVYFSSIVAGRHLQRINDRE